MRTLFRNPYFNIRLLRDEYKVFCEVLPLTALRITNTKKSKALSVVGVDNPLIFDLLAHHDPDMLNAFHVVLFALELKSYPVELSSFLGRIDFRNEGFRRRLFQELKGNQQSSVGGKIISCKELNEWWELDSKYDDGGEPIIK